MKSSPTIRVLIACVFAGAWLACGPSSSIGGAWSYTAGGGATGPYEFKSGPYRDAFDPTWTLTGAAIHPINRAFSVRLSSSWARHDRAPGLISIPEDPPARLRQRVDLVPVSAGLRWTLPPPSGTTNRAYIDVAPALVWSKWYQRFTQVGRDFNGNYIHRDAIATRAQLRPAVDLGLGVSFRATQRVHPEFGVRYLASSGIAGSPIPSLFGVQRVAGLKQWSAAMSVGWER